MNGLRLVPTERVRTEAEDGADQIVAEDLAGRRTAIGVPGLYAAVKSLLALLQGSGWKVRRVEVRSLSGRGGVVVLRRWFRRREVRVHAAYAVGIAVQTDAPLWMSDTLFVKEAGGIAPSDSFPPRVVH